MGPYHPFAIFSPTGRIGRLQYLVGFGYIWVLSVADALLLVFAQSQPAALKYTLVAVALLSDLAIWGIIILWVKARLADAGMSAWWLCLLALLFVTELRAAIVHPYDPVAKSTDMAASLSGWDHVRAMGALGTLGLLVLLTFLRGRREPAQGPQ